MIVLKTIKNKPHAREAPSDAMKASHFFPATKKEWNRVRNWFFASLQVLSVWRSQGKKTGQHTIIRSSNHLDAASLKDQVGWQGLTCFGINIAGVVQCASQQADLIRRVLWLI